MRGITNHVPTVRRSFNAIALIAAAAIASPAFAGEETFVETFEGGSNEGQWTWGNANDFINPEGGNPGAFLQNEFLDTFAPRPRTTFGVESVFIGDFQEQGVTSIGIDLKTFDVQGTPSSRPLSLMLIDDGGDPNEFITNTAAFIITDQFTPVPGDGWRTFDIPVPSQSTELPEGWDLLNLGDLGAEPFANWQEVITSVDQVRFFYGNPENFFIFQGWNVGMDNPRITFEAAEPADLNGDGVVDGADLGLLLGQWGTDGPADLNDDGVVDGADLGLLLGAWGEV